MPKLSMIDAHTAGCVVWGLMWKSESDHTFDGICVSVKLIDEGGSEVEKCTVTGKEARKFMEDRRWSI